MCDDLEKIADGLPDHVDQDLCMRVVRGMQNTLPLHHADEEKGLFPLLERRAKECDNIPSQLAQLRQEHETDEGFAEELIECLTALAHGKKLDNPDMCGYMMRGFFESYRRHIRWEQSVLLPLARRRLHDKDIAALARVMAENRNKAVEHALA